MHTEKKKTLGGVLGECLKSILVAVFKILILVVTGILKLFGIIATKVSEIIEEKMKH